MLTPRVGRSDGNKIDYLQRPADWTHFDPTLFELLRSLTTAPDRRRLTAIEESGVLPSAIYFNRFLPDALEERRLYFEEARCKFAIPTMELRCLQSNSRSTTHVSNAR
jgi:hypothetical protein